jgi:hypothetical protein
MGLHGLLQGELYILMMMMMMIIIIIIIKGIQRIQMEGMLEH